MSNINRRNFIQTVGLGATFLGAGLVVPKILAKTDKGHLVKSKDLYGDFVVEKMINNNYPYEINPEIFSPMNQRDNVFSRDGWDPLRADRPRENMFNKNLIEGKGKVENQTRLDYALMAASWTLARTRGLPSYDWEPQTYNVKNMSEEKLGKWIPDHQNMNWEEASMSVKHAATFYGASMAGIAELNPNWIYTNIYSPTKEDRKRTIPVKFEGELLQKTPEAWFIPKSMNRVIALVFEEDYYGIQNSPGRLASAATGDGYSRMAYTAYTLAEFIRALGYRAIPSGNGLGLSIPIAIDAGLGELGRNGLLVTPKFGPRVRIAKVITDMPLTIDSPINFGVREFCENCMLCADDCPSGSIPKGPETWKGKSPSNNPGIKKWYITPEPCNDYNGFSCSNCKRVCPFNKPNNSWMHKMIRTFIKAKVGLADKLMVTMDQASGYGAQMKDDEFWEKDQNHCLTSRSFKE